MRNTVLGSIGALLAGAGLAWAQATPPDAPAATMQIVGVAQEGVAPTAGTTTSVAGQPVVMSQSGAVWNDGAYAPTGCGTGCGSSYGCEPRRKTLGGAWFSAEYLLWTLKPQSLAEPLISTTFDESPDRLPILGRPGTAIVYGADNVQWDKSFNGLRLFGGFTLNCDYPLTVGLGGFWLQERSQEVHFQSEPDGSRIIGRPFIDASNNNVEATYLVSFPGAFAGGITVSNSSELYGMEILVMGNVCCSDWFSIDWIGGFRFMSLEENVRINADSTVLDGGVGFFLGEALDAGAVLTTRDSFDTKNRFYGGEIGFRAEIRPGKRCFAYVNAKVGLGATSREVSIDGSSNVVSSTINGSTPGGLLALPSNIGTHSNTGFSAVPEIGLNVGYDLSCHCRVFAGYSFLFWQDVARPGEQLDRTVSLTQVPTSPSFGLGATAFPKGELTSSDFWAHGFNVGLGVRF